MNFPEDPRIADSKNLTVQAVLDKLQIYTLKESSGEYTGPCPLCGSEGHDPKSGPVNRFNINKETKKWLCRKCGINGGDMIQLVREVTGKTFPEVLEILCGEAQAEVDPKEAERKRQQAKKKAEADARRQNKYRRNQRQRARDFYARGIPGSRGVVGAYLRARGLPLDEIPTPLRFLLDHPYVVKRDHQYFTLHRGPCMLAPIVDWQTGEQVALHQTWIDPEPPHGKARIFDGETRVQSKLTMGSWRGNFIPLITPPGARTLVVAEGIESTLSAYLARPPEWAGAAFWAGVNLDNMSTPMLKVPGKKWSGIPKPNPDKDYFKPPPWVDCLVYVEDGDSSPAQTRPKMLCGLARARMERPGIETQLVPGVPGFDLNDVLNCKHQEEGQGDDGRN